MVLLVASGLCRLRENVVLVLLVEKKVRSELVNFSYIEMIMMNQDCLLDTFPITMTHPPLLKVPRFRFLQLNRINPDNRYLGTL